MPIADRTFGWQVGTMALYADNPDPTAVNTSTPVQNLLTIYKDCEVEDRVSFEDGRGTAEFYEVPVPTHYGWSIRVGTLVDSSMHGLIYLRRQFGWGPYWVWIVRGDGQPMRGRVYFETTRARMSDGPDEEGIVLRGVGPLEQANLG